jgi:glycosyltransferase involved in cell wall biosynthesis
MRKIEVGCDSFAFRMQNYGGVTNVIESLYREINENSEYGINLSFYEALPPRWQNRLLQNSKKSLMYFLNRAWEEFGPSLFKKKSDIDMRFLGYHYDPHYDFYKDLPLICMVYDFIPEYYPELFQNGSPHLDKLEILKHATLAVCISEETKRDLIKFVPEFKGDAIVIPLASKFPMNPTMVPKPKVQRPYVLYVGRRDTYKNVDLILKCVDSIPEFEFVFFGGEEMNDTERSLIGLNNLCRVHHIMGDDYALQGYYENAFALIVPSKIEGFGLPILEAMSLRCPVIASEISVFHELFGDNISYFDSEDRAALISAIRKLSSDTLQREKLIEKGLEKSKEFSWPEAALLFSEACRKLYLKKG